MSWTELHAESEHYAGLAQVAAAEDRLDQAAELYRVAAQRETLALRELDPSKRRTLGVTAVSAAALWSKAGDLRQAELVAHQGLGTADLPAFALDELRGLLHAIWSEEARRKAGIEFSEGEVLVSVGGGEVVTGGAPLDLILRKVDEVKRMFYRTVEMLLDLPLRTRGAPSQEIQEQFRPWLFQAPAGSYQFAVRVERPRQLSFFPDAAPRVEEITEKFLQIVRASVEDPHGELVRAVPDQGYRDTFLKLTRNLAPTGKVFGRLELRSATDLPRRPVVLVPTSREAINEALRKPGLARRAADEGQEHDLRGVLRGLHLDDDWIEINPLGEEQRSVRIVDAREVIDDVVGPMVNHRVIVSAVLRPDGKYSYRDIQPED